MLFLDKWEKFFAYEFQRGSLKQGGGRGSVEDDAESVGLGNFISSLMSAILTLQHSVIYFPLFVGRLKTTLQSGTEFVGYISLVLFLFDSNPRVLLDAEATVTSSHRKTGYELAFFF